MPAISPEITIGDIHTLAIVPNVVLPKLCSLQSIAFAYDSLHLRVSLNSSAPNFDAGGINVVRQNSGGALENVVSNRSYANVSCDIPFKFQPGVAGVRSARVGRLLTATETMRIEGFLG